MRPFLGIAALACLALAAIKPVHAQNCSADDFAKAVDGAGEALRQFNSQNAPTPPSESI